MSDVAKGVWAMIGACMIWGLSPMFYKLLAHVPPLEVLAHRTLWSLVLFVAILMAQHRLWALVRALAGWRRLISVVVAALLISANWFLFIWAIQVGRALEASLGYYIFPLVAVFLGMAVFSEPLNVAQRLAISLAALAVLLLSVGLGVVPWIALVLATTFALYGVAKKRVDTGPVVSVAAEVLVLAPLAAIWLWGVHTQGWQSGGERFGGAFGANLRDSALLVLSGPMTAAPLMLFSYAMRRVRLSTIGVIQYLNPSLQFMVAVLVFGEPFSGLHLGVFAMIWLALVIYSAQALLAEKAARKVASSAGTSSAN